MTKPARWRERRDQTLRESLIKFLAERTEADPDGHIEVLELIRRWAVADPTAGWFQDPRIAVGIMRSLGYPEARRIRPEYPADRRQASCYIGLKWKD